MPTIRMIPAAKISASCHVFRPPPPLVDVVVTGDGVCTGVFGAGGAPSVGACWAPAGDASARTSAVTAIQDPTRARIRASVARRARSPRHAVAARYAAQRDAAQAATDQGRAALRAGRDATARDALRRGARARAEVQGRGAGDPRRARR